MTAADRQLRYVREGREDLVYERSRNLPTWAEDNPHTYFRAAERYEAVNRVAFEEWKVTLPQELTHAQNMALTRDLVDAIAADKLPITYAFHDPTTMDGRQHQPHLHFLISARQNDAQTRPPAQHFKRYNRAHPARGGAEKDPAFWHRGAIKAHRVLIADILNLHLEHAGHAARVHPDSLEQRDLGRNPEPKLLPSESRAFRERGEVSERMAEVLKIRAERVGQWAREQVQARTYWEGRKAALGMTRDLPMEKKLQVITQARAQTRDHAPARPTLAQLQNEARRLTQEIRGPTREPTATTRHHRTPSPTRAGDLARQFQRLARQLAQEDAPTGGHLRVRLHDQEHERDQGMGL